MSLLCLAKILCHEAVAPGHYRLTFAAPELAQAAEPGQFVHVRCGDTLDPLLRRPLSLHGIDRTAGTLTLLYRVVGKGTELLSRLPAGGTLDVMGPLGRGFYLPEPVSGETARHSDWKSDGGQAAERAERSRPPVNEALVVGGGLGVAPLLPLVEALVKRGLPVTVILGARSGDGLLGVEEFGKTGAKVELATDDGSRGIRGSAVDLLKQRLEQKGFIARPPQDGAGSVYNETGVLAASGVISETSILAEASAGVCVYSCGPVPMLRAVWRLCADYQVPLQVSLEERMGCGVGACLACVCQVKLAAKSAEAKTLAEAPGIAAGVPGTIARVPGDAVVGDLVNAQDDNKLKTNQVEVAGQAAEPGAPQWKYARVCVEGPVFWGEEVVLDAE